jgi:hypothetical protein
MSLEAEDTKKCRTRLTKGTQPVHGEKLQSARKSAMAITVFFRNQGIPRLLHRDDAHGFLLDKKVLEKNYCCASSVKAKPRRVAG